MKVIIAGSRRINDYTRLLEAILESKFEITEVVSGTAKGVDMMGEKYALEHNLKVTRFPPEWHQYGRAAGPKRNKEMADYGEALIAIYDGSSPGTQDMIRHAKKKGLPTFIDHQREDD